MRVALGRRGDYLVRAVLYLARHPGRQRREDVGREMEIPVKYLPQLMAGAVDAGIVRSIAGRSGGYLLARDPADVSLLEVIEIAEGPVRSTHCALRGGACYWDDQCAMHAAWSGLEDLVVERLAGVTFADLARSDAELEAGSVMRDASQRPDRRVHHREP